MALGGIGLLLAVSMFLSGTRYNWMGYPAVLLMLATWPLGYLVARRAYAGRILALLLGLTASAALFLGGPSLFIAGVGSRTAVEVEERNARWETARVTSVATGEDLGWTSPKCSYGNTTRPGFVTSVWIEPTGWMRPSFVDCHGRLRWPGIAAGSWLVVAGAIVAARMATMRRGTPSAPAIRRDEVMPDRIELL